MSDVVEVRHPALNAMLLRASRFVLNLRDQQRSCKLIGCEDDCEDCERVFNQAQEARRDVLRFVDEHYSLTPSSDVSR